MRTIRVSDAVHPVVGHRDGLRETLGLVVHAARPHRVDVAPVVLTLRVDQRVAVDLRVEAIRKRAFLAFARPEAVVGPEAPDLERSWIGTRR